MKRWVMRTSLAATMLTRSSMALVAPVRPLRAASRLFSTPSPPANYELEGTVVHVGERMTFSSGRSKVEFIVKTQEQYPQEIRFDVWNERQDVRLCCST